MQQVNLLLRRTGRITAKKRSTRVYGGSYLQVSWLVHIEFTLQQLLESLMCTVRERKDEIQKEE
jgi:hypothetical protein